MVSNYFLLLVLLGVPSGTLAAGPDPPPPSLPGQFVPVTELHSCPKLEPRPMPTTVDDVRPDDFTVVMALGDSISAGLLAQDTRSPDWDWRKWKWRWWERGTNEQQVLGVPLVTLEEYRGASYAIGGDPDSVTLPSLFSHYARGNITGASVGHHPLLTCVGSLCGSHPETDQLNAAVSGSISANLVNQAIDYLIPMYESLNKTDGWAYLNLGIGANDICAFCMSSSTPGGPGTPQEFAQGIHDAVQLVRNHVPRLVVNIIGLFRVSAVYKMTVNNPYCRGRYEPPVPHLPLECGCAFLPGPAGDYTRGEMDRLSDDYDQAVLDLVEKWNAEGDETFGVIWQPGSAIDLEHYPIKAVSPVDCFHPSLAAHKRLAACYWNRLTLPLEQRAVPMAWEDEIYVRCLEESDRIRVREEYRGPPTGPLGS